MALLAFCPIETGVISEVCSINIIYLAVSKSKWCYVRRAGGQSISVSGTHVGPMTRSLSLSDSCGFADVGHLLWLKNGSTYSLQLPLVLASMVVLGLESHGTNDCVLLSQIQDSLSLEGQIPIFISPYPPIIPPGSVFPFPSPLTTRKAAVELFSLPPLRAVFYATWTA
jgi:hypothetical protein